MSALASGPARMGSRRPRAALSLRRVLPVVLGTALLIWVLLPLVPVALWSVAGEWRAPAVLPEAWSSQALTTLVSPEVLQAGLRSAALGLGVAVTGTVLGALAAFGLRQLPRTQARILGFILLAPLAIPPFALVMGANVLLLSARVPTFAAVLIVLTVTALPYTAYMFHVALASYDWRFEEVARTLGASPTRVLLSVRMALLAPAIARAGFLAFLVGWSDYITTVLIGGGQLRTLPMLLGSAASTTGGEQLTAALSLAMIAPPVILLILLARWGQRGRSPQ
ncbi:MULTISPECIES: ABC transporter permease subunit [unclassified Nesterenkonia]|uniref:ABC transporter permease n=1 Tax=unclassified Nesterenkonia TaxID=2629769 RepID=UPI001A913E1B|nr:MULTISPECIES: ABC transporter permease subunit [unclassified Nesterenkonia]